MHKHFQESLVGNTLAFRDFASLQEIGFGQADRDLHAGPLRPRRNQTGSRALAFLDLPSADFCFT
jgi:hypothetical protein